MKLSKLILEGPLEYDPAFEKQVDKLRDRGGVYLGSGDYGSVYFLDGKAVKVTTDPDEILHAILLKGKKTNNFVHIYSVEVLTDRLAIIEMEPLGKYKGEIPEDFIQAVEKEADRLEIDPDELDFVGDNIMIHPKSQKLKMIDV